VAHYIAGRGFYLGRFPPAVQAFCEGKKSSVLESLLVRLFRPPATIKACLKYKRKIIVDIVTFSPVADTKLVQLWPYLGVARSGREST
jgi:hypothetical protein